ncbi:CASP-like protein 5A1 [Citrus sinensis]|uniref:CASP-like protein 5A1 n=1 Tax=Citrus sinensis TaxID=2711 RepID=A0ACB8JRV8_CITSI|nr:CASP-like protein 5A1 [Citrus sinensis]
MFASRPAVHPVEAPPLTEAAGPRVRMKDVQGMPGTPGGLVLRLLQFVFAAIAVSVMASTSDFHEATAFCYLVLALGLQSLWSISLLVLDIYAILVRRSLRNDKVIRLFTVGDGISCHWSPVFQESGRLYVSFCHFMDQYCQLSSNLIITSTLTYAAACSSAGITVLISNDLNRCGINHCTRFETATAMAFINTCGHESTLHIFLQQAKLIILLEEQQFNSKVLGLDILHYVDADSSLNAGCYPEVVSTGISSVSGDQNREFCLRATIMYPRSASKVGEMLSAGLGEVVDKEHERLVARKSIIEKLKLEEHKRQLIEMEWEEESRRMLRQQKKTAEEAEQKRLAAEFELRKNQRILLIQLEGAQALLDEEAEKCSSSKKKEAKKPIMDQQLRERQEMDKKLRKLAKTLNYLERANREEAIPLIEAAFQQRLEEERVLHEIEQQQEVELSRERHDEDLKESIGFQGSFHIINNIVIQNMSNEQDDERRLYQCVRKYKIIVKQFDELIEMMSARTKPPKRRRVASRCGGSSSNAATTTAPASSSQPDQNEVFVQTISRFLQDLRTESDSTTDPHGLSSTRNQK